MIRHAGLVALRLDGLWRGALIEGPSGAGKSGLALGALDAGLRLVSDDRTLVFSSEGRLFGRAPAPLAGLIEARGLGVLRATPLPLAEIALLVRCTRSEDDVERLPDPSMEPLLGIDVPVVALWTFDRAAPAKLRRALEWLGQTRQQGYQACLAPPRRRVGA